MHATALHCARIGVKHACAHLHSRLNSLTAWQLGHSPMQREAGAACSCAAVDSNHKRMFNCYRLWLRPTAQTQSSNGKPCMKVGKE